MKKINIIFKKMINYIKREWLGLISAMLFSGTMISIMFVTLIAEGKIPLVEGIISAIILFIMITVCLVSMPNFMGNPEFFWKDN